MNLASATLLPTLLPSLLLLPLLLIAGALAIWARELIEPRRGDAAEPFTARLALLTSLSGGLIAATLLVLTLAGEARHSDQVELARWLQIGDAPLLISLCADPRSLALATLFALLGTLTVLFSIPYLHREAGFHRYFAALLLFLGAIQLIVLAGSAWLAFVGWELAGVASYLLIGYGRERPVASGSALYALVANRIGDAGFLMAIGFSISLVGSLEWPALTAGVTRLDAVSASLIALGFVAAALVKSAQVPFTPWIARALEGPTPSSAIFYGSLLLHAGVVLVLRLEPLLRHTPEILLLLALAGAVTTLYAGLVGLAASDLKSSLLYSALAQVGLMFVACGLGWFELAAVHLGLHVVWRLWQFLIAPSWLRLAEGPAPLLTGAPARWLARPTLHSAARQGFWLHLLGELLLSRPTARLARDMATIDARVIEPALGLPGPACGETDGKLPQPGIAGQLTGWVAGHLARFEAMLVLQKNGGNAALAIRKIGAFFTRIEMLLEQPRYLFLFIMATLVVIL